MVKYLIFFFCSIIADICLQHLGSLIPVGVEGAENKILSLFLVFSDLFYPGKTLVTNTLKTHWWAKLGKEMLFIPECQIGCKGVFFLWNFASFPPSTWLRLTLFRALNWRGEILVFQGKKKELAGRNRKVKKEKGRTVPSVIKLC